MKKVIYLLLMIFCSYQAQSQTSLIPFDSGFDPIRVPIGNCINCFFGEYDYGTGTKFGVGVGLVKEISPKFDLTSTIGYSYWSYKVVGKNYRGIVYDSYEEKNHLINLSLGERFHLFSFEKSSIYSGVQLNFQLYTYTFHRDFGLSLEPTVGWRKSTGEKTEIYFAVGYDQHLTSYNRQFIRKPSRLAVNFGFNIRLKSKNTKEAVADEY